MLEKLNLSGELDESFAAFVLKTMPLPVMIVNKEVKVWAINEAAQQLLCISSGGAYLRKCGDVLKCVNATRGSEGCGELPICSRCVLRKSVLEAFEGRVVSRNKGHFHTLVNGEVIRLTLLVTASPIICENIQMVIVLAEDISLITQLQGLIPICSVCHHIRDDKGEWMALEKYLMLHAEAELTHDFCPICCEKMREKHALSKK
ncbi:hypothetical protein [Pelosinus sp. UFO1]|uniref:hypothetical protein n=1 Tax=Pelosinus sp. UFO1 TaxID=484770 RepID=UPI0004D0B133|nr:hypothetical protein [Pelosinus sp. UFO1]AIF53975.1 hypothetical protein UFO1_4432 [Pelosinus sp. UFO1]